MSRSPVIFVALAKSAAESLMARLLQCNATPQHHHAATTDV
jgi:hypothetical protein